MRTKSVLIVMATMVLVGILLLAIDRFGFGTIMEGVLGALEKIAKS